MLGVTRRSRLSALLLHSGRCFSSSGPSQADELKAAFLESLPKEQKRLKAIKEKYGTKEIHNVNVGMALGGMRGITGLLYETSLLDADEGIRFRGYTIPELQVRKAHLVASYSLPQSTRLLCCRRPQAGTEQPQQSRVGD